MDQMMLDLPQGGLCWVSFSAAVSRERGWTVEIWHRHHGSSVNCGARWHYEDLSLEEMRQLLDDVLAAGNGPYHSESDDCVPGPPLRQ